MPPGHVADSIDVRQRRDTAAPPFGSWNAWIGLVVGGSRCVPVIPLGGACQILGRSWKTLAPNMRDKMQQKVAKYYIKMNGNRIQIHPKSTKMLPKSAPKAILEASRLQGRKNTAIRVRAPAFWAAIWLIWGAILDPACSEGGAKIALVRKKST